MGRACSTNGEIGYWWERQKERDHWEDRDVDVDNIRMDHRMGWYGFDWCDSG
jgi:hypothetical protein